LLKHSQGKEKKTTYQQGVILSKAESEWGKTAQRDSQTHLIPRGFVTWILPQQYLRNFNPFEGGRKGVDDIELEEYEMQTQKGYGERQKRARWRRNEWGHKKRRKLDLTEEKNKQ